MNHPASVEQAIKIRYGVYIPVTACDMTFRRFKIDQFHNGFVLKTEESAVFGSIIGCETWIWRPDGIEWIGGEHKENKEIRFEWLIWAAAKSIIETGNRLTREDGERLALAVKRLEAWL